MYIQLPSTLTTTTHLLWLQFQSVPYNTKLDVPYNIMAQDYKEKHKLDSKQISNSPC